MRKIEVNRENEAQIYKWLKQKTGGSDIEWNFTKFLTCRDGQNYTICSKTKSIIN